MQVEEIFARAKLVPVVVIDDAANAARLADAMVAGELPVAEVTFRTAAAPDAIRAMSQNSEMVVGAGTVLSVAQAEQALEAGAEFIVSPGLADDVVEYCQGRGVRVFPGATSATEMTAAISRGLSVVKFFPAEANGGAAAIKAYSGPFGQLRFMPTGGISERNLHEYLSLSQVLAVGGSWMVPQRAIAEGDFTTIEGLCRDAVSLANSLRKD
ncbi:bifunctional 4-hydroxy-2-oxoglutarate aldolase/2-dehydro-3-deoxy-phosphogluconate aldolase [Flaviflexus salsibiostraticola]|uniref:Bifunctional 4-hydroxy-2-oxoglutarate aldolase/2-dehydro-3-deoxy-phosphogluconate aldolase n=1 Tax=Flaviflexus salsibiostraticola TaxID=1282737 RepID=A0A3Q8WTY5_9ACTO|nr:bifunctional 4-hydroxy-2-oxoglutarate aldolase/2-dehydro-3-deoxy-phosphogluconate aldolase [Flaviflexus salsibiostraticola]AZN30051.1 bifunctional 4-hydroxy-2-oxoglutarate aldolase/2-dehydro-3-deoxy-phosphogluconate aldolase [Flaviflexus salsibiostraticola]